MKIVIAQPPNIEAIHKVLQPTRRVIFCYGDTIYNPDNIFIDIPMHEHEAVHSAEQEKIGVERWWKLYLEDPAFRVSQELLAYRKQYQIARVRGKVKNAFEYARKLAEAVSGDTYGHAIPFNEALNYIIAR